VPADALVCDVVADLLPAIVDGQEPPRADVSAHVEGCLRCQAELVQYRKLLRALQLLRTEVLEPAPGLLGEILASLGEAGEQRAVRAALRGRRVAYVGGIAAATAAGAAGAIVLASRARQRRVGLAG
jgi:anti-sigma factor RsiW